MRLPPFGPLVPFGWLAAAVALILASHGPLNPAPARAQDAPGAEQGEDAAAEETPKAEPIPLGRFTPRDNLLLYVESAGLESRGDAWRQTAAYRMLNETSLGVMLEEVGARLVDRLLDYLPNRKITGAEAVTIAKHLAREGWALGLNADAQAPNGVRGVLVLRGAVSKEMRPLSSRLMGSLWTAGVKPKIERKNSRVMVVVPPEKPKKDVEDQGWIWWPEGDDLVIGLIQPSDAESVHAALDGQSPSVEGFEPVANLAKPEDGFEPVLTVRFDPTAAAAAAMGKSGGEGPGQSLAALAKFFDNAGVKWIDHRWGFDGESLMSITRLGSPKPRKGLLALFDDPSRDAKNLLAFPDGVDYFASMSIKPDQWPEAITAALGGGEVRAEFDAFVEELRARRVELGEDLLANLGPRTLFYMAPGGSAAAPAAVAGAGMLPAPLAAALAGGIPRPVLVAEVADPSKVGRALEALIFEVNKRIKSAAMEQAAAIARAEADARRAGAGGPTDADPGAAPEGGRAARKRDAEPALPEFQLIPGSTSATERIYMLNTPTSSPVKPLPPGVKPTIRLEGPRLVFSTSPEAARLAIETLRDKDWSAPPEVADAVAKTPDDSVFILYGDSRDTTPTSLASLPGTLQAQINMAIALAARQAQAAQSAGDRRAEGAMTPDGYSMDPGDPGMASGGDRRDQAAASPNLIQIRVDPDHLPRANELRAFMFPTTTAVTVDDESIRIVVREAFPDAIVLATANGALAAILIPAISAMDQAAQGDDDAEESGQAEPGADSSAPGDPSMAPGDPAEALPGDSAPSNRRRDEVLD